MEEILTLQDGSFRYENNSVSILDAANYSFYPGTLYTIIAPSGTGKTTLISILAGLETLSSGKLLFNRQDVLKKVGLKNYRKNFSSIIFQAYNLIPYMTALQNVVTALTIQDTKFFKNRTSNIKLAKKLLSDVGLTDEQMNLPVLNLSGGQQQRVAIARSLSSNAPIIFADEPTGNLDQDNAESIMNILQRLAHDKNKCVVVVTHDMRFATMSDVQLTITNKTLKEM